MTKAEAKALGERARDILDEMSAAHLESVEMLQTGDEPVEVALVGAAGDEVNISQRVAGTSLEVNILISARAFPAFLRSLAVVEAAWTAERAKQRAKRRKGKR